MHTLVSFLALRHTLADRKGATAIEYALIAAGIGIVIAGAAMALGTDLQTFFGEIGDKLTTQ